MNNCIYKFRKYKPSDELISLIKKFEKGEIDEKTFKKRACNTQQSMSIARELKSEGASGQYFELFESPDGGSYTLRVAYVL